MKCIRELTVTSRPVIRPASAKIYVSRREYNKMFLLSILFNVRATSQRSDGAEGGIHTVDAFIKPNSQRWKVTSETCEEL